MAAKYDDSSIKILEGLEAVRKRPGMYIGSTDRRGLHHLVWEIVDNSIDEAINGYGKHITITIHKDKSISVADEGRGVPVGMHASGKSTPEVIYTVLHAGGKFEESGYKVSGGLHGVGGSVVNALSEWMEVTIKRDKGEYYIRFEHGGKVAVPLKKIGTTNKTGTTVRFLPDKEIFPNTNFSFTTICERMQESAFLLKGLTIEVIDEEDERHQVYCYEKGLEAFVDCLNDGKVPLHNVIVFEGMKDKMEIDIAMQYTDTYQENIVSFVNNVKTSDGGSHEVGFKTALTKVFNDYAKTNGFIKGKEKALEGSDVREGLTAVISLKIPEELLQFEGQTKGKLGTPQARTAVEALVTEKLQFFLEENKAIATEIINKSLKSKVAREAARKAREEARKGKNKNPKERALSGKLAPAQSKDKTKKELFLVEGDSAGGSAKQGRDRKYQAILPLRGKVLNTEKTKESDILKNEEINTMIYTIGAGYGQNFDINDCEYSKVIIMSDADEDGGHIQCLLLTFFYRYMRPLIEDGRLYVALPPLFKIQCGKEVEYAYSMDEMREKIKGRKCEVQRYKGLGEMNADQLCETTMKPGSRTLIRVNIEDAQLAEKRVSVLMGDDVPPRKEWIEENVEFSLEDDYEI
ncbi:MAG TPA: DNA topoisomerase IV subunit B [Candidatus Onthousia faecigallinarum]|nr:DNA topoisomerase IV subunit B [Candidatus Onthousia faecigallinarum]